MRDLTKDQRVQVRWASGDRGGIPVGVRWLDAIVYRVYERGADCIVGSRGLYYFTFEEIR